MKIPPQMTHHSFTHLIVESWLPWTFKDRREQLFIYIPRPPEDHFVHQRWQFGFQRLHYIEISRKIAARQIFHEQAVYPLHHIRVPGNGCECLSHPIGRLIDAYSPLNRLVSFVINICKSGEAVVVENFYDLVE